MAIRSPEYRINDKESRAIRPIRVAINGFGRIGKLALRTAFENPNFEVVAINSRRTSPELIALEAKYDSTHGIWGILVCSNGSNIVIDGQEIPVFSRENPRRLPWEQLGVDVVIEATGCFTDCFGLTQHLESGARTVVLSAPPKNGEPIKTILRGVNDHEYTGERVVSVGSCTTNCAAPLVALLHEHIGVRKGMLTTVHAFTPDQNFVDGGSLKEKKKDLRRARAAFINIVPTSTGAAISVTEAIPHLKGNFNGTAYRVPVADGSVCDITLHLTRPTSVSEVNALIQTAIHREYWKNIVAYTDDWLISGEIIGRPESAIVFGKGTTVVGDLMTVRAFYDNEWGFTQRLVEVAQLVGSWKK